jgi:hypothetical protein
MFRKLNLTLIAIAVAGLVAAGCGSDNPADPSGTGGVTVQGVLLGEGAAFTASSGASSSSGSITVEVEGTSIMVTIPPNGTFKLEDVPLRDFTLIFRRDGVEIGRIEVDLAEGIEGTLVDVVVKIVDGEVVLIKVDFGDDDDDDGDGGGSKATVCHKGKNTLSIDESAVSAHLGHGDTLGACGSN